jgi:hypothetical protein
LAVVAAGCSSTQPNSLEAPTVVTPTIDPQGVLELAQHSSVPYFYHPVAGGFGNSRSNYSVLVANHGAIRFSPIKSEEGRPRRARHEPIRGAEIWIETSKVNGEAKAGTTRLLDDGTLAIDRGGVVETVKNARGGVEQSWSFDQRPGGTDLEIRVAVSGEKYAGETAHGLHFVDEKTHLGMRYGVGVWVDANKKATQIFPRYEDGEIVLKVPARVLESSAYPAVLDPTLGPELAIDTVVNSSSTGASAAYDPVDKKWLVLWIDGAGGTMNLYGSLLNPANSTFTAPFVIASDPGNMGNVPCATWDGSNFLIAWVQGFQGIAARRMSGNGTFVVADGNFFPVDFDGADKLECAAASNNTGTSLIVYSHVANVQVPPNTPVFATWGARISGGAVQGTPGPIQDAIIDGDSEVFGGVASNGSDFFVTVDDTANGRVIGHAVSHTTNAAIGPIVNLSPVGGAGGGIAFAKGNYMVTWAAIPNAQSFAAVFGQAFNAVGTPVDNNGPHEIFVTTAQVNDPVITHLGFDGTNLDVVAFTGFTSGENIVLQQATADNTFASIGPVQSVATGAGFDFHATGNGIDSTLITYELGLGNSTKARLFFAGGADGAPCSLNSDCTNNFCVSGICCHTACPTSACAPQTCATGTCQPRPLGSCIDATCTLLADGCAPADTDGDGLSNAWETSDDGTAQHNHYIDLNCNGVADPSEPLLPGADPNVKDIYIRYDWMDAGGHNHQPPPAALAQVTAAFLKNNNVNVHFIPAAGNMGIPEHQVVTRNAAAVQGCAGNDFVTTQQLRAAAIGNLGGALDNHYKHPAYHYMVFAHNAELPDTALDGNACPIDPECGAHPDPTNSGSSDIYGDDIIVAFGYNVDLGIPVGIETWAGTTMHEIGHNLGLKHGSLAAPAPSACYINKPNYLSVMDYSYQSGISIGTAPGAKTVATCNVDADCTEGPCAVAGTCHCTDDQLPNTCYRIDYESKQHLTLVETSLTESQGIGGTVNDDDIVVFCAAGPGCSIQAPSNGGIDWNRDGDTLDSMLNLPIAGIPGVQLDTTTDWNNVKYTFQCSTSWGSGAPGDVPAVGTNETGLATSIANHNAYPPFTVGIDVRPGCGNNWVAVGGSGSLPVAILGSSIFAVSSVAPASPLLEGVAATSASTTDVNGDGYPDILLQFPMASLPLTANTTSLTLTGWQKNSRAFSGTDTVTVVSGVGPILTMHNDGTGFARTLLTGVNHAFQAFTLADCVNSATDRCGNALSINAIGSIYKITSDETNSGYAESQIDSSNAFEVRRERLGGGDGRVYTIYFTATDGDGSTQGQCKIQVEHDAGWIATDSGVHDCVGSCP